MRKRRDSAVVSPPPPLAQDILKRIVSSFVPSRDDVPRIDLPVERLVEERPIVLSRLLHENPREKDALAGLYEEHVICATKSETKWAEVWSRPGSVEEATRAPIVFVESGSTCAYVSELLRKLVSGESHRTSFKKARSGKGKSSTERQLRPFQLRTNNNLTAWLFLGRPAKADKRAASQRRPLFPPPYLFAGHLESKYHGIFPFRSEPGQDGGAEERQGYAELRLALAKSDLLLLAASRLSLCYGPLVGSRENAIFKNACYNACVPPIGRKPAKEIHLFLTVQKLVAHTTANQALVNKAKAKEARGRRSSSRGREGSRTSEGFGEFHTWAEELGKIQASECYPAFSMRSQVTSGSDDPALSEWQEIQSRFAKDLISDNVQRLQDGTAAVEMGDGRFRVCDTWVDLFTKAHLTVKVFVAFSNDKRNVDWISREVDWAGKTLKPYGIKFDFEVLRPPRSRAAKAEKKYALAQVTISASEPTS